MYIDPRKAKILPMNELAEFRTEYRVTDTHKDCFYTQTEACMLTCVGGHTSAKNRVRIPQHTNIDHANSVGIRECANSHSCAEIIS